MPAQRHDIIYWSRMKPICASSSRGCTQRIRYGCGVHEHRLVSILYTQALNTISDKPCTPLTEIYIDISEMGENISTVRKIYSIYYSWYIISNKKGERYSPTRLSANILSTDMLQKKQLLPGEELFSIICSLLSTYSRTFRREELVGLELLGKTGWTECPLWRRRSWRRRLWKGEPLRLFSMRTKF